MVCTNSEKSTGVRTWLFAPRPSQREMSVASLDEVITTPGGVVIGREDVVRLHAGFETDAKPARLSFETV